MKKACVTISVLLIAIAAQANVIYQDDFSGLSTNPLNAAAPDQRLGLEIWTATQTDPLADTDPRANGSFPGGVSSVSTSGQLPISIENGKLYTFTIDLKITNSLGGDGALPTHWMCLALNKKPSGGGSPLAGDDIAVLLLRRNGAAQALTRGTGGSPGVNVDAGTYNVDSPNELKFVLDTTAAKWSVDFFINGTLYAEDRKTSSSAAGTHYVSIGNFGSAAGEYDNLSVTVIPEPATMLLLSLGGLVLRRSQR